MSLTVSRLVAQAQQSAQAGRRDAAERAWKKVLDLEPGHTQALTALGSYALDRGDPKRALELLAAARITAPTDLTVLMALGAARKATGDEEGELEAIQWALAVDPGFMAALLARGSWCERHGEVAAAQSAYIRALENAPPEPEWPVQFRPDLQHARAFVEGYARAFHEFLDREVARTPEAGDTLDSGRWREAAAICSGRSQPFESRAHRLHVPRLPAIPFFETEQFPFLDELEANVSIVRDEFAAAMEDHGERFEPLIELGPGEPVGPWQQLNHSSRLTALHLWREGEAITDNQALCPRTVQLVRALPLCELERTSPNAYFSVIAPGTQVPPHYGESNALVTVCLPLEVSGDYVIRVGFEERRLAEGELLIFDDTLDHEASNSSSEASVVLVFDLWNPLLNTGERRIVDALHRATRRFAAAS